MRLTPGVARLMVELRNEFVHHTEMSKKVEGESERPLGSLVEKSVMGMRQHMYCIGL